MRALEYMRGYMCGGWVGEEVLLLVMLFVKLVENLLKLERRREIIVVT